MQSACAILQSVVSTAPQYFSTFSHKWYGFKKNVIEHKMYILILSTLLSATFLILGRNE